MSLPNALLLVLIGTVVGAVGLWRSLSSARPEPVPLARRWRPTQPGPAPRPRADRPRRYAVEHTTPTVRLPHLAAALEAGALPAGGDR